MKTIDQLNISTTPWRVEAGESLTPMFAHLAKIVRAADSGELGKPWLHVNDAKLIAAAPVLYSACLEAYEYLSAMQQPEMKETLRKALELAGGGEK